MHSLVTAIAKYLIGVSALLVLLVLQQLKRRQQVQLAVTIIIGGIIAYLLAKIGSHLYYDPRPFVTGHFTPYFNHANDNGFPSDHTLLAGLLAFAVWPFRRRAALVLLGLALLIGGSRVIAGVHHSLDIIGALLCAAVGAAIGWYVVCRYLSNRQSYAPKTPPPKTS
jgi:undecaprenyl-diphosphatase